MGHHSLMCTRTFVRPTQLCARMKWHIANNSCVATFFCVCVCVENMVKMEYVQADTKRRSYVMILLVDHSHFYGGHVPTGIQTNIEHGYMYLLCGSVSEL